MIRHISTVLAGEVKVTARVGIGAGSSATVKLDGDSRDMGQSSWEEFKRDVDTMLAFMSAQSSEASS